MTPSQPPTPSSPDGYRSEDPATGRSSAQGERGVARPRRQAVTGLPQRRLSSRAMAFAVGAHLVVGIALFRLLTFGHGLPSWMRFGAKAEQVEERLTYVTPKMPVARTAERRTTAQTPTVTRPVPPTISPAPATPQAGGGEAPTPPRAIAPQDTGSGGTVGNGIGALDPNVRGVRPGYTDERVWRGDAGNGGVGGGGAPKGDRADHLNEIMANAIMSVRDSLDSLARAQGKYDRAPGDWTKTDKNGRKWGWDQTGIRLGKYTLPNALLALLPLNASTAAGMSANPTAIEAGRRVSAATADIRRMSERGMGDAEFRRIVKEMDARRDTQRRERLKAPSATLAAPVKSDAKAGSNGQP